VLLRAATRVICCLFLVDVEIAHRARTRSTPTRIARKPANTCTWSHCRPTMS